MSLNAENYPENKLLFARDATKSAQASQALKSENHYVRVCARPWPLG